MYSETWRDIVGYKGYYKISNTGLIKSLDRKYKTRWNTYCLIKGRILSTFINKDGYRQVVLSKEGKQKRFVIHRLVAIAFIKNECNKPCIDHIDGNRLNNNSENLRWCTNKENMNNPVSIKRLSESKKGPLNHFYGKPHTDSHKRKISKALKGRYNNKLSKPVMQLDKLTNCIIINTFKSICEAERITGIPMQNISSVCKGKGNTAGGFRWKYINE